MENSGVLPRFSRPRPKYLLFAFIGLMVAYVLGHNERFLIDPQHPEWPHIQTFKWWLLPHGIAGACALILGPMQFSDRLRQRYAKFHRVVGRIYVAGVFIAAPLGTYIQYFEERMGSPRSFSLAAATDAALWMATTAIALMFILRGKVQLHRPWMVRIFAVAIVLLEVRVVGASPAGKISATPPTKPSSGLASPSLSSSPTSSSNGQIFAAQSPPPPESKPQPAPPSPFSSAKKPQSNQLSILKNRAPQLTITTDPGVHSYGRRLNQALP